MRFTLKHLERELKLQLFVRHHAQGLALTSSGKRMMREAKLLLRQSEGLLTIAGELRDEVQGRLAVGCMVTLAPMIAPGLAQAFLKKYPGVNLSIHEGSHEDLLAKLRQIDIDIAISYDLDFPDDVLYEPLANLPPQILVSNDHPIAKRTSIALSELEGQPMILLDLPHSRQYFFSVFQSEGLVANVFAQSSNQEVVRSMVARGFGFTITNVRPRSSTTLDGRRVKAVKLTGKHKPMRIGIATLLQNHKPKVLEVFEQHCRDMISEHNIPGMLPIQKSSQRKT